MTAALGFGAPLCGGEPKTSSSKTPANTPESSQKAASIRVEAPKTPEPGAYTGFWSRRKVTSLSLGGGTLAGGAVGVALAALGVISAGVIPAIALVGLVLAGLVKMAFSEETRGKTPSPASSTVKDTPTPSTQEKRNSSPSGSKSQITEAEEEGKHDSPEEDVVESASRKASHEDPAQPKSGSLRRDKAKRDRVDSTSSSRSSFNALAHSLERGYARATRHRRFRGYAEFEKSIVENHNAKPDQEYLTFLADRKTAAARKLESEKRALLTEKEGLESKIRQLQQKYVDLQTLIVDKGISEQSTLASSRQTDCLWELSGLEVRLAQVREGLELPVEKSDCKTSPCFVQAFADLKPKRKPVEAPKPVLRPPVSSSSASQASSSSSKPVSDDMQRSQSILEALDGWDVHDCIPNLDDLRKRWKWQDAYDRAEAEKVAPDSRIKPKQSKPDSEQPESLKVKRIQRKVLADGRLQKVDMADLEARVLALTGSSSLTESASPNATSSKSSSPVVEPPRLKLEGEEHNYRGINFTVADNYNPEAEQRLTDRPLHLPEPYERPALVIDQSQ